MKTAFSFLCFTVVLFTAPIFAVEQTGFTDESEIKTFLHANFDGKNSSMVVGLLDERGSRIFSAGRLDNDTSQEAGGNTVFEIGSITKPFTVLLLLQMVERGEMKMDDPVARYLPSSVKVPEHGGKAITLANLAAQDSGLPFNAGGLSGSDWLARYNEFTVEKMYAFLSSDTLTNEPGAQFQYSNLGMSLLGNAIALKAGTNFEQLVLDRICRPLHMDDTCIILTPEQAARAATGHDENGKRAPDYQLQAMAPAGALHSTVDDLLKYLSANLGLTPSSLQPLMEKMQVIRHRNSPDMGKTAMPWFDQGVYNPPGTEFLGHSGGTAGSSTFVGFDKKQRRAVVVLSNQQAIHSSSVGWRILQGARLIGTDARMMQPFREYIGSGIAFAVDKESHELRITAVYPNTSAARAGLAPGLTIAKINGVATMGKSMAECLNLARGEAGATLSLELIAKATNQTNTVELIREKFQL